MVGLQLPPLIHYNMGQRLNEAPRAIYWLYIYENRFFCASFTGLWGVPENIAAADIVESCTIIGFGGLPTFQEFSQTPRRQLLAG